jgi:hypothetical protein
MRVYDPPSYNLFTQVKLFLFPQEQEYVEISDEQAEKVASFKNQGRLAFLINGEITNFLEQGSLGNSMRWNTIENKWDITSI